MNIDLAPTFLEMAGLSVGAMTTSMDGRSFLSLLGNSTWVDREWREDFLVEHKGEYKDINAGCPQLDHQQVAVGVYYRLYVLYESFIMKVNRLLGGKGTGSAVLTD